MVYFNWFKYENNLTNDEREHMSILVKIHEISFYGLISTIISLVCQKISLSALRISAFQPDGLAGAFLCYLFLASVLFVPIAIIGAFYTKYSDWGRGLSFTSSNIIVILFAHIAEELLGLILSPFWFLKDVFTRNLNVWKSIDYALYAIELALITVGLYSMFYR